MTKSYMNKLVKIARSLRNVDVMSNLSKNERINAKRAAAIKARNYAVDIAWNLGIDTAAVEAEMQEIVREADADEQWQSEYYQFKTEQMSKRVKTGWEKEVMVMIAGH
jgi:hypothetical protein